MNIKQLTNHIKFDDIFERNTVDGKIQWCKIACDPNLPARFIDQYFNKLKSFGLERLQVLDDYIVNQHANELNWYSLLKYQFLSEDTIKNNLEIIERLNLWPLVLKTQKLSYEFLIDNLDRFKNNKRANKAISQNGNIDESIKNKIQSFLPLQD